MNLIEGATRRSDFSPLWILLVPRALTFWIAIAGVMIAIGMVAAKAEGAIARSDDDRQGLSYNHSSSMTAEYAALNDCGADCRIIDHFHGACAAIARNRLGGFGYGIKPHEGQAQHEAFLVCERESHGCGLVVSGCDYRGN
ncbi:DUF4189 domain-containing protein [Acidisphaera sp. L21]|uniref:DUF4189 domain-containing protein n=1 Tax=Acidisphaera sp. L21 TaxID=1641851 RepID=UPI00131CB793|nr:DUF4189 domain-containing protein [Acidisphaera sp. L21]